MTVPAALSRLPLLATIDTDSYYGFVEVRAPGLENQAGGVHLHLETKTSDPVLTPVEARILAFALQAAAGEVERLSGAD